MNFRSTMARSWMGLLLVLSMLLYIYPSSAQNQTRALCYSGSNLYQQITQNCNDQDSSYEGSWYCSTIEICEPFMDSSRHCITTRGCATEQECQVSSSTSTSSVYSNTQLQTTPGINPAGMDITISCCLAHNFENDDAVTFDYNDICNSAPVSRRYHLLSAILGVALSTVLVM